MSLSPEQERFSWVLDLYEAAEQMMRQNLRREHPDASDEEIERLLVEWLHRRPGAPYGDAEGRPVPWPRPR